MSTLKMNIWTGERIWNIENGFVSLFTENVACSIVHEQGNTLEHIERWNEAYSRWKLLMKENESSFMVRERMGPFSMVPDKASQEMV